jgi:hypothetical protein
MCLYVPTLSNWWTSGTRFISVRCLLLGDGTGKMETVWTSETSVLLPSSLWRHHPESGSALKMNYPEGLKSSVDFFFFFTSIVSVCSVIQLTLCM